MPMAAVKPEGVGSMDAYSNALDLKHFGFEFNHFDGYVTY